eukprot:gb/GFBE01009266.1/.p1 GENE.gb/GFBE01009266.1/~~gb/GFBE01009266.1/.p1  ORF type:complete len:286 (+),score=30.90 gb/GFBE01009266.1/:1-858(+)
MGYSTGHSMDLEKEIGLEKGAAFSPVAGFNKDLYRALACLAVILLTAGGLSLTIGVRHLRRGEELQPLLDAIVNSKVCSHTQTRTCALELSDQAAERFDLHIAENPLFGFLYGQVVHRDRAELEQILRGAHVDVVDQDGSVYTFLTSLPGATRRTSSHSSDRAQYGIPEGRVVSTLLVGRLGDQTWFQLEGHPWGAGQSILSCIGHALDFIEYVALGRNVGPLGTSRRTDEYPLIAGSPLSTTEACSATCGLGPPRRPAARSSKLLGRSAQVLRPDPPTSPAGLR